MKLSNVFLLWGLLAVTTASKAEAEKLPLRTINVNAIERAEERIKSIVWRSQVKMTVAGVSLACVMCYLLYKLCSPVPEFDSSVTKSDLKDTLTEAKYLIQENKKLVTVFAKTVTAGEAIPEKVKLSPPQNASWFKTGFVFLSTPFKKLINFFVPYGVATSQLMVSGIANALFFKGVEKVLGKDNDGLSRFEKKLDQAVAVVFHPTDLKWFMRVYAPFDSVSLEVKRSFEHLAQELAYSPTSYDFAIVKLQTSWELMMELLEQTVAFMKARIQLLQSSYPTSSNVLRKISEELLHDIETVVRQGNAVVIARSEESFEQFKQRYDSFEANAKASFERFAKFEYFIAL